MLSLTRMVHAYARGGCRIFEMRGAKVLGLHAKKRGAALGTMLKREDGAERVGPGGIDPLLYTLLSFHRINVY